MGSAASTPRTSLKPRRSSATCKESPHISAVQGLCSITVQVYLKNNNQGTVADANKNAEELSQWHNARRAVPVQGSSRLRSRCPPHAGYARTPALR